MSNLNSNSARDFGLYQRLMDKTVRITESGCWIFMGAIKTGGYGDIWRAGRVVGAHKASYELFVGDVPDGMDVCHICDVRCCINPHHLFVGTRKDNMQDCRTKGRVASPGRKLSSDQVTEIRNSVERVSVIARRMGVTQNIVSRARKGITYGVR